MKPMATSAMVEVLTPIWQRVLQLPSVGVDDNFFDLGGDSALALELFHQIALAGGRELPPVMIYHAPTITALAAALERPETPSIPALVQLKAGAEDQPVFIAHGLGGSALDFFQVVKYIEMPKAIYGLQAKGIDGAEEPLDRIEDMAAYYLEALDQLQTQGSSILIGYSFGGLIALEMAQRLSEAGKKVALLVLIDTYPHPRFLPPGQRLWLFSKRIVGHIHSMTQMPIRRAFSYFAGGVERGHDRRQPDADIAEDAVDAERPARLGAGGVD